MALILKNADGSYASRCPLCGEQLVSPIFATSHFIGDTGHDLHRYSDAAMHWDCYAGWEHQARFADLHFQTFAAAAEQEPTRSYWPTIFSTADVRVRYGVAVNEVSVLLRKSGTDLRVRRGDWKSWLSGRWTEWCHHDLETRAVSEIVSELRAVTLP